MRVLTFSDIHYKENFDDDDDIKQYLTSFGVKIDEIHSEEKIDFVIISGDLSFSGKRAEHKKLRIALRKIIPKSIPIYSIPGNHDVYWTALKNAIGRDRTLEHLFSISEDEIITNLKFKEVFDNYATFYEEVNIMYETLDDEDKLGTYKFHPTHYSGYVYNKKEKILILLLNSAWKSFGPGVIKEYYDELSGKLSSDEFKKVIEKFVIGDSLSQKGNQSYFFTSYPYRKEVLNIIENDEDVKVLTIAHHPPSWLTYEELFEKSDDIQRLDSILDISHLLITGHLHNSVTSPTKEQQKTYHLMNGAFLEYHRIEKYKEYPPKKFADNWFTIIDILESGFTYNAYKLEVSKTGPSTFSYEWKGQNEFPDNEYSFDELRKPRTSAPAEPLRVATVVGIKEVTTIEIKEYTPKKLSEVINLFKKHRKNEFSLLSKNKTIEKGEWYNLSFRGKTYIIINNSLGIVYEEIKDLATTKSFKKKGILIDLYTKLKTNTNPNEQIVVAFFDFIKPENGRKKETFKSNYEAFYKEKTAVFQSFKHFFFVETQEFNTFTELNIIYDIIIK